jgi:hypothetical protein
MMAAQFRDDIGRARAALLSLDPGMPRSDWVRAAMAAKAAGLDVADFIAWSRPAPNFKGEGDCGSVWRSVSANGGVGPGTLFAMAAAAGWRDDSGRGASIDRPRRPQEGRAALRAVEAPLHDAQALWDRFAPADLSHPYIARKLGLPDGLCVVPDADPLTVAGLRMAGALVVPILGSDGRPVSLQFVAGGAQADAWKAADKPSKLNLPGALRQGSFIVGGEPRPGSPLFVCEGIGAAWSAYQASSSSAVVAFGAGRVEAVARDMRERFPAARLVLVADVGKEAACEGIAREVGGSWVAPPADLGTNGDVNDLHQRDGLQAVADLLAAPCLPNPKASRFPALTADDLASLPPLRWRVRGMLPEQGLAAIYGPSSSGKSFLTLDMLAAVSEGREWFGRRTVACPVSYVALEGQHGIKQRTDAYRARFGHLSSAMRFFASPFALLEAEDVQGLSDAIRAEGGAGGIVVIDTLNGASPGADENDSRDMGRLIAAAKALEAAVGGLVLLVHHTGKDASRGLRGHSSLLAALDAAIEVTRDGDRREWRLAKSKDGRDGDAHPFRLAEVELGVDADGDTVSSCVIDADVQSDACSRRPQPHGTNQRTAWEVLGGLFRAAGDVRPDGAPASLPSGRPALQMDAAVNAIAPRLVVDSKRRRERATAAIRGLCDGGLLRHEDGWLWCA